MNRVTLIGRLGRDPSLKYTAAGKAIANCSAATDEFYKDKNGELIKKTEWHKVSVWDEAAVRATATLQRGTLIAIEGKLQTHRWKDKEQRDRETVEVHSYGFTVLADGKVKQQEGRISDPQERFVPSDADMPF
jgi:single-strand DNA-binding protein